MTHGAHHLSGTGTSFFGCLQKITTIVDTTFPHGYAIGFGLSDSGARSPPTALYSNFSYQPLPVTTLTPQSAVATATVQANQNLHATYAAAVPGDLVTGSVRPAVIFVSGGDASADTLRTREIGLYVSYGWTGRKACRKV